MLGAYEMQKEGEKRVRKKTKAFREERYASKKDNGWRGGLMSNDNRRNRVETISRRQLRCKSHSTTTRVSTF